MQKEVSNKPWINVCPCCDCNKLIVTSPDVFDDEDNQSKNKEMIIECSNCGFSNLYINNNFDLLEADYNWNNLPEEIKKMLKNKYEEACKALSKNIIPHIEMYKCDEDVRIKAVINAAPNFWIACKEEIDNLLSGYEPKYADPGSYLENDDVRIRLIRPAILWNEDSEKQYTYSKNKYICDSWSYLKSNDIIISNYFRIETKCMLEISVERRIRVRR